MSSLFTSQCIDRVQVCCLNRWEQAKDNSDQHGKYYGTNDRRNTDRGWCPEILDTTFDNTIPTITPMTPPILVSMAASVRNWKRMTFFLLRLPFSGNLTRSLCDRYQHDVHNTDTADQKRNARDPDQLCIGAFAEFLHISYLLHHIVSLVFELGRICINSPDS